MVIENFLKENGYRLFKDHPYGVRIKDKLDLFQKFYDLPEGRFFINIWKFDNRPLLSRGMVADPFVFQIEINFELSDSKNAEIKFYSFSGADLLSKLDDYEVQCLKLWKLLNGVGEKV